MKKKNMLIVLILMVILGVRDVAAQATVRTSIDCQKVENNGATTGLNCSAKLIVEGDAVDVDVVQFDLALTNLEKPTYSGIDDASWEKLSADTDVVVKFKNKKGPLAAGTYTIGQMVFNRTGAVTEECKLEYTSSLTTKVNTSCAIINKEYYDKAGNKTTELNYQKECMVNVCKTLSDGTKYGKEGTVVDDLTYQKECEVNTCKKLSDGTMYGKDSTIITDELVYQKECEVNTCKILSDGTMYGKDSTIVTDELTYQKECGTNTCKILSDGTRYGKDGATVDELTYQKECMTNVCKTLSDGTMYGKEGNVVDKETYDKECNVGSSCSVVNGVFYGKDGKPTSEVNYKNECEKNICKQIGNVFYDKDGNVTTEAQYNAVCKGIVENPKTGSILPLITLVGLGNLGVGGVMYARKNRYFM